jgi:rare lipoprotein A
MLLRNLPPLSTLTPRALRIASAPVLLAVLAACQTTPTGPGNVSRLPPGNSQRDGPEAKPPPNLEAVPDAVPQVEPQRIGGPNKPYEIAGHTYVPLTDGRALTEKGLASWYGKKFHGHRTASGEAYNMYAMTAAHKTLPIPSYARVRNPANGKEVIVRVNDRGPFSPGRVIDLSYTAALKLGVLNGVAAVEITRITDDDIRTGAVIPRQGDAGVLSGSQSPTSSSGVDLGVVAAVDAASGSAVAASIATVTETAGAAVTPASAAEPARNPDKPDEHARAVTTAGIGYWIQLGAFKQREGALDFQRLLIDEQPWLAPLLAVFTDHGLNKLQAGPYSSRDDARGTAELVRTALQLVPTIVEKR